ASQNPPPLAGEGRVGAISAFSGAAGMRVDIPHLDPPPQAGGGRYCVSLSRDPRAKALEIFHPGVAEDGADGGAGPQLLGKAQGCDDIGAGRGAGEERCLRARRKAMRSASSVETRSIASGTSLRQRSGTKPTPIPSILCAPGGSPESTADSAGSTATA